MKLSRREFTRMLLNTGLLTLASGVLSQSSRKPNVLLILTDDQGFGDLSLHGNKHLTTPNMDRLAKESVCFDRFFVSPVCAPTRASLLSGRYHLRTGVTGVTRGTETMRSNEVTLAEVFQRNGYSTGCFGKWHNGAHYPEHPNAQGFDEFVGFCAGHYNEYFDPVLEYNGKPLETSGYISDILTDKAIEFMEKNRSKPFLCYLPYNAPHTPTQVPDIYYEKYHAMGFDEHQASIYGMIENLDDNIERLMQALQRMHQEENTVLLFLTDNGPNGWRYNAGMKGKKGWVDEGGVRVPLFIRWPGVIKPGKLIEENAAHIDILPTLADLCDIPLGETLPLDGKSLEPLIKGDGADWPDRMIFTFPTSSRGVSLDSPGAVRTQRWRAIKRNDWKLFDIIDDPGQTIDVATKYSWITETLSRAYMQKFKEVTADGTEAQPVQIGHPQAPVITLQAHEAVLMPEKDKGIAYCFPAGYAHHWITDWTDTGAYPVWKIDAVQSGLYEVIIYYACKKENVGTQINVSAGKHDVTGVIRKAHDPDLKKLSMRVPEEHQKYMIKTWKPHNLGQMKIDKGQFELKVRALDIPGSASIELKAVELRSIDAG